MSDETNNGGEHSSATDGDTPPPPLPKSNGIFLNPKPIEPAAFPVGFWHQVDYLLQYPEEISESLRRDDQTWDIIRIMCVIAIAMSAAYGAVMGATNLLQSSDLSSFAKFVMITVSAVKVPVLFLLTLVIVIFPIYVSSAFVGTRFTFTQIAGYMVTACCVTSVALASMASVSFFFALTSTSYHFIKLLHVLVFAYAGVTGLTYLGRALDEAATLQGKHAPFGLRIVWLALYSFVGTQLAWVLRPFIGNPDKPFELFRPRSGNFYESVFNSLLQFFSVID